MSLGSSIVVLSSLPPFSISRRTPPPSVIPRATPPPNPSSSPPPPTFLLSNLLSLTLAVTLNSPLLSSPALSSPSPLLPPPTTPFSQSKSLQFGLEDGKIRPCPAMNPGCISTNPKSSSFAFPLTIPPNSSQNTLQKLKEAILETQKNAKIEAIEENPEGKYLRAEVDGRFGRDMMEFVVKGDAVGYRCVATKVTYLYPFTTALGDSKGQEERMKRIIDRLGWYAPSFDSMD